MYAQLGNIKFEKLIGYSSLSRTTEANYAQHDTILSKPKLQRVGTNLEVYEFSIKFHASFCSPEDQIDALHNAMVDGEILPYTLGNGRYLGDFVINSISHNYSKTDNFGNIIAITCDVKITEYVESGAESATDGFANSSNNPVQDNADSQGVSQNLGDSIGAVYDQQGQTNKALSAAEANPDQQDVQLAKVVVSANQMDADVNDIETTANDPSIFDLTDDLRAYLSDVRTSISNLRTFAQAGDLTNAKLVASNFDIIRANLQKMAAPAINKGAIRGV